MTCVSVVMIVKDEAEMVQGFLEAAVGLWDELVVVDTGSTDGTPELFAAAGARVFKHAWRRDFAEARNVSLSHARGDWVLVLDADERVSPAFIEEFRARCEDPAIGALTIRLSNPLPFGHRRESWIIRAWRRDDGVHFEHVIHEDVSRSLTTVLATSQRRLARVDSPVEHLGYVRERAAARHKKRRDLDLLQRALKADRLDFYAHLKLLELARFWRDSALWRRAARRAADALDHVGPTALAEALWGAELIALMAEGLFKADSAAGLSLLDRWAPLVVPGAPLFHRRAQHHEALGDLARAREDYERCLALEAPLGDRQLSTVRPRLGLARLALMSGRFSEAMGPVDEALLGQPRDPAALVAAAALKLQLEGSEALDAWMAEHTRRYGASAELAWAVGDAALTLGRVERAIPALRQAAGVPPSGPAALRLAQALLCDGQLEAAENLTRGLVATEPEAGLGVLLFDLLKGRDTALELDLTPETAHASMRRWVDALLLSENRDWLTTFARNSAAVGAVFPWLGDYLRRAG
ncbi:MAG: glycosyltransferase [Myxococcaceae bacterium]|nr:glycosyltransferase [Myxococcaceae bacterium]